MLASDAVAFGTVSLSGLPAAAAVAAGGGAATAAPAATLQRVGAPPARLEVEALPACSTRDELVARVAARSTPHPIRERRGGRPRADRAHRGRAPGGGRRRADGRRAGRPQVPASDRGAVLRGGDRRAGPGRRHHARPERGDRRRRPAATGADGALRRHGRDAGARAPDASPAASPAPPPPARHARDRIGARAPRHAAGHLPVHRRDLRPRPSPVPRRRRCRAPPSRSRRRYDRASILSPALALTFAHLWSDPLTEGGGTARVHAGSGRPGRLPDPPGAVPAGGARLRRGVGRAAGRRRGRTPTTRGRWPARSRPPGGPRAWRSFCRGASRSAPGSGPGRPCGAMRSSSIPRCFTGSLRLPWLGTSGSGCGFRDRMTAADA